MTAASWDAFRRIREEYRAEVARIAAELPELRALQQRLVDAREGGSFTVDTPVVYNGALDDVTPQDEIRLILVADNPGRREQAAENRRYLVGPSGKLAGGFFAAHPELGIEFRRNALILNKTPIHTPRTAELRELGRLGGPALQAAIAASQAVMVRLIRGFHTALSPADNGPLPLWIIGYSELGPGKLFAPFSASLAEACGIGGAASADRFRDSILLFRHFSMNQFSVDIRKRAHPDEPVAATLARVGADYRRRCLGW